MMQNMHLTNGILVLLILFYFSILSISNAESRNSFSNPKASLKSDLDQSNNKFVRKLNLPTAQKIERERLYEAYNLLHSLAQVNSLL